MAEQTADSTSTIEKLVLHPWFQRIIIALILLNGVVITAETYLPGNDVLLTIDTIIVWLFVLEAAVKLKGLGIKRYFSNGWNIFDFTIVTLSLVLYNTPLVSVLRLVRVLRLIRMIPAIPALKRIIDSLVRSIPALTGILGLTSLIFSMYAIIGTVFFRDVLPYEFFGSFHTALFTLLQVVTFESWASQVARPVIAEIPWAWFYFVSFIIVGALIILNLVVAVILDYLGHDEEIEQKQQMEKLFADNQELKEEMQEIKELLKRRS
ncbi:ion transporter [Alkalicoccus urumqiensis]|uniref:Ion transporter n=1 Tax=Alkalicoccus urumqiensis TaxID=1548213 RepID=A0A2P6MKN4_ALKUR|nr:ion transporter [Alkalicoccus urumqiensis]PRO66850.1 ion transporter [Alkalicoccus urumqiensis]